MDTKGARTNLALKLALDEESTLADLLPKTDPAKKVYNSELEI